MSETNDTKMEPDAKGDMPAPTAVVAPPSGKKFVSAGWRIHNETTYRLIDWLLNATIGVTVSFITTKTKLGLKWFGDPVTKFFTKILKPFLKAESLKGGAQWGSNFLSIMFGGFTIIPVMMLMENKDRKKRIVRWLDEKIYGKEKVANDPKFEESYRRIDEEPKKGFWIGISSRLITLAPLLFFTIYPSTRAVLTKYIYNPIANLTSSAAESIGIRPKKMMNTFSLEHINDDPKQALESRSNWTHLHRLIGFDFGLTMFYAVIHEVVYKALAAMGVKKFSAPDPVDVSATQALSPGALASDSEKPAAPSTLSRQDSEPAKDDRTYASAVEPKKRENIRPRSREEMIDRSGQEAAPAV